MTHTKNQNTVKHTPIWKDKVMTYKIVEKKNLLAVHGLFHSLERAQNHLANVIPEYVRKGYYMDKTLTKDCFTIKEESK